MSGMPGDAQTRRIAVAVLSMVILTVAAACGGGESASPSSSVPGTVGDGTTVPGTVIPVDTTLTEPTIPVLAVGESAVAGGVEVVVRGLARAPAINNGIQPGNFVLVDVSVRNVGDADQRFGPLDWRVEAPDGTIVEPEVYADTQKLSFGTLTAGATADGTIAFDLGDHEISSIRYRKQGTAGPTIIWAVTPTDLGDA